MIPMTIFSCLPERPKRRRNLGLALAGAMGMLLASSWAWALQVSGLESPHSFLADPPSRSYFISNINGETNARDNNGFITKLSDDGRIIAFKFIEGGNIEALYHEEIYRLTIIDGLTQIPNRRYLVDFLERELARSRRHERPLHLAMLDVDHFKKVNDEMGHVAGDTVLRGIAQILNNEVRRDELAARFGGEEFSFVLPETDLEGAIAFCERVRTTVGSSVFRHNGREIRVTVSLGLAGVKPEFDSDQFIAAADRRLYGAKAAGRNCVVYEDRD